MEVEFNTSFRKAEPVRIAIRNGTIRPAGEDTAFRDLAGLKARLNAIPVVRTEKVETGQTLAAAEGYPADQVLDSLATLLALKLK
jgi:hypothetical protein